MPAYVAQHFHASKQLRLTHPARAEARPGRLLDSRPLDPSAGNDPQLIAVPLEPARLARRLVALVYDSLLVTALLFVFMVALFMARGARGGGPPDKPWIWMSAIAISALFFCGFWTHGGQTSGMR